MCFWFLIKSYNSLSIPVSSTTNKTRSAFSTAFFALSITICSIKSSESLMPAVSNKWTGTPDKLKSPSTTSRVVPAIEVTIALSSWIKALSKEDLPTLGLPTIAILTPSL